MFVVLLLGACGGDVETFAEESEPAVTGVEPARADEASTPEASVELGGGFLMVEVTMPDGEVLSVEDEDFSVTFDENVLRYTTACSNTTHSYTVTDTGLLEVGPGESQGNCVEVDEVSRRTGSLFGPVLRGSPVVEAAGDVLTLKVSWGAEIEFLRQDTR